ncbi:MAG: glycine zipper domain-containing protein [Thiogranum sp.]
MNKLKYVSAAAGLLVMLPGLLVAQELMVYPAKGQSSQQQEKDKFECYGFAKGQSGFDPMAPPTTTTAPPPKEAPQGGAGRGAVGGALGGALVGAIAGDTRKGAAIGAVGGGLLGGARRSEQKQREAHNQQQWEQREVQNYSRNRNNYNRAYAACLEGRGYTVR